MAYGIRIRDYPTIEAAAAAAENGAWPKEGRGYLYRVDAVSYAYRPDPYDDYWASTDPALEIEAWPVYKWTKCGATLYTFAAGERRKFVNLQARKQFACRTPAEAMESFRQRRKSQIRRLEGQLARARKELALAEDGFGICDEPSIDDQIRELQIMGEMMRDRPPQV